MCDVKNECIYWGVRVRCWGGEVLGARTGEVGWEEWDECVMSEMKG